MPSLKQSAGTSSRLGGQMLGGNQHQPACAGGVDEGAGAPLGLERPLPARRGRRPPSLARSGLVRLDVSFSWDRFWLDIHPGVAAIVGGALLIKAATRSTAVLGRLAGRRRWCLVRRRGPPQHSVGRHRPPRHRPPDSHVLVAIELVGFLVPSPCRRPLSPAGSPCASGTSTPPDGAPRPMTSRAKSASSGARFPASPPS